MKRLALIIFVLFGVLQAWADTSFADSLFERGEYYRAITEYYRDLHTGSDREYCHSRIRQSFLKGEDYHGLIDYLDSSFTPEDRRYRAHAWISLDRADIASNIISAADDPKSQSWYALSEAYKGNFDKSNEIITSIPDDHRIPLFEIVHNADQQSYRSPTLAAVLGLVPGLGYAYTGSWQTAVSALLTNALLLATSYELLDHGLEISGIAAGTVGMGFYLGNMVGSAQDAVKRNRRIRTKYLDQALEPLLPILLED